MARVKRGVIAGRRHKKVLAKAKGYYNARRKVYRAAKQAVIKAGQYAYRDRRAKKRDMRALWITRINAAARLNDMSYSVFMSGLKKAGDRSRPEDPGRPRGPRPRRLHAPGGESALGAQRRVINSASIGTRSIGTRMLAESR